MATVEIVPLAENDLEDIWTFIAAQNIDAASQAIYDLMKTFERLAQNPEIGREKSEFIVGVRSFPHKKYIIFYFPTDSGVQIFRVLHGARNIEGLFDDYFSDLKDQ